MTEAAAPPAARARSHAIDALRGAAIISMFAANLAGPCLLPPHPLWLRIYGSFAAPAFVFLAGLMTSLASRPAPVARLLERSVLLLLLAAGIDWLCWGIDPFETCDVLYLLALGLPVTGLCRQLNVWAQLLLAVTVLALAPWLRHLLGYGPLLPDELAYPWPAWRRWLVDGWFPIFPWLGVALLGGTAGRFDLLSERMRPWLLGAGSALVVAGGAGWLVAPPSIVTRTGYSELFYPPSLQYLAVALGAVLLMLAAFAWLERRCQLTWLAVLGRASLVLYVAHVALIALVLDERFPDRSLPAFLGLYGALLLSAGAVAWLWQRYGGRLSPGRGFDGRDGAARTTGR